MTDIEKAKKIVSGSDNIVFLDGAEVSCASGIPFLHTA